MRRALQDKRGFHGLSNENPTIPSSIQSLINLFTSGGFVGNIIKLAGGTALGRGIIMLATPLFTRLYTTEDFGLLTVYIAIFTLVSGVASLQYQMAIPLPKSDETAANLLVLSLIIVIVMSLGIAGIVSMLQDQIVQWVNTPGLRPYLWLLPLSFCGVGIYQALSSWAVRKRAFTPIAKTTVSKDLATVLAQLVAGLLQFRPLGLLVGDAIGRVSGSGTLGLLVVREDIHAFKRISPKTLAESAKKYFRFPIYSSPSILLNSAGLRLPPLLIAGFYGAEVAGWFGLVQRVIGIPVILIGTAVAQVYIGEAALMARENPARLYKLFRRMVSRLLLIGCGPIILLGIVGPHLFQFVFGEGWYDAGVYVRLLTVMILVQFVVFPLSRTLSILELQDIQLAWDAVRLILVAGGVAISGRLGLPAEATITVYGWSMALAYAALFIISALKVRELSMKHEASITI
jgi:O-antigen/teichoic acid export membrane protein